MKRYLPIIIFLLALILIVALLTASSHPVTPIYPDKAGKVETVIWTNQANPLLWYPAGIPDLTITGKTVSTQPMLCLWHIRGYYRFPVQLRLYAGGEQYDYIITDDLKYLCDLNGDRQIDMIDFSILTNNWLEQL